MQSSATSKSQARSQKIIGEYFYQCTANHKILFDLFVCLPWHIVRPFCYVSLWNHSSISISVFTITFQRSSDEKPLMGADAFNGTRNIFALFRSKISYRASASGLFSITISKI